MLSVFESTRAFLIPSYDPERYDFEAVFNEIYENTPAVAYGVTGVSGTLSPESGDARVMEVTVSYTAGAAALLTKSM